MKSPTEPSKAKESPVAILKVIRIMSMGSSKIFIQSMIGGLAGAISAGLAGLLIAGLATAAYYVIRITLSLQPFIGSTPDKIMSSITDTASFSFSAIVICTGVGAVLGFVNAFSKIYNRRSSIKDFLPR